MTATLTPAPATASIVRPALTVDALVCDQVNFHYVKGRPVLTDVSLTIPEGEVFGLLGPNGAGKSTLVKLLLGLNKPGSGTVRWFGEAPTGQHRRILGFVPQELSLLYDLSALANVQFFGRLYGLHGDELKQQSKRVLEFVGLWDERNRKPGAFSGGMKRRLNIACGIVHQPKVIVLDEPTVGVDPQSRDRILEAIQELNREGATVVYISHYMEEVARICTTVGIIDEGRYLAGGTIEELLARYAPGAVVNLEIAPGEQLDPAELEGLDILEQTPTRISIAVADGDLRTMGAIAERISGDVTRFTYLPPNLEQVFFRLTRKALRD